MGIDIFFKKKKFWIFSISRKICGPSLRTSWWNKPRLFFSDFGYFFMMNWVRMNVNWSAPLPCLWALTKACLVPALRKPVYCAPRPSVPPSSPLPSPPPEINPNCRDCFVNSLGGNCMTEYLNGWMREWLNVWMTCRLNAWMTCWLNVRMTYWQNVWMTAWLSDWLNECMNDWRVKWLGHWMFDWLDDKMV